MSWKSGWLPVVISISVITFLKSKKLFLLLLVLVLVIVLADYGWWKQKWTEEDAESGNRFDKWTFLFAHHSTWGHWLLGTGPFGYARYFMTYFPDNSASTHSNYIDLFLQLGVVGCVVFAWLMGAIAWVGYKLYKMDIEDQFIAGFVHSALGGLVAVLVAMTLGDWFTPFVLNQGLHGFSWTVNSWIFLGALVAVPFILCNERKEKESLEAAV
jgi:O-antigen ligase